MARQARVVNQMGTAGTRSGRPTLSNPSPSDCSPFVMLMGKPPCARKIPLMVQPASQSGRPADRGTL